jgi:uncharacterized membrane protein YqaE (UPF0057 family)
MILEKLLLTVVNIFCPPLAVFILAGGGPDVTFNLFLFLLAVIPSHFHSFYVSSVYFYRTRKVRKGLYPGGPKPLIWSSRILNGGASPGEAERLKRTNTLMMTRREDSKQRKQTERKQKFKSWVGLGTRKGRGSELAFMAEREWEDPDGLSERVYERTETDGVHQMSSAREQARSGLTRQTSVGYEPESQSGLRYEESPLRHQHTLGSTGRNERDSMMDAEERPPLPQRSPSNRISCQRTSPVTWEQSPALPGRRYSQPDIYDGLGRSTSEQRRGRRR